MWPWALLFSREYYPPVPEELPCCYENWLMERLANTHILFSLVWVARSIFSFMLQRRKLCWERVRLLQEVSGRGLNRAQISWCGSISSECSVSFCQRWQSGGPGFAGHLKSSALSQAQGADTFPTDCKERTEHFPFSVLLHIEYKISHLGVNRRHDFHCRD